MSTYDVYSPSPQSDKQLFDALVASQEALEEAIAKQKAGESRRVRARKPDDQNVSVAWWWCVYNWFLGN
jgi:hypothetical protein